MERKPTKKIREGLTLLINGLLDDIVDLAKTNSPLSVDSSTNRVVLGIIGGRMNKIEGYLEDARMHKFPKEDLSRLETRYQIIKNKWYR